MPGKDGTGPLGKGPIAGRAGRRGRRGGIAAGPEGECVFPKCGEKVRHAVGVPCTTLTCPKCGSPLVREA